MNAQAKLTVEGPQHEIASLAHHLKKIAHRKSPLDQLAKLHLSLRILCHDLCPYLLCPFPRPFHVVLRPEPPKTIGKQARFFFLSQQSNLISSVSSHWTEISVNQNKGHFDLRDLNTYPEVIEATKMRCLEKRHGLMTWWCSFSAIFCTTGIYATSLSKAMDAGQALRFV